MPAFRIVDAQELHRRMVARIVARSPLSDLAPGDPMMQVAGAVAVELEDVYLATARLLEFFGIDGARGADLDRRALEYMPDGLRRQGASRATGTLRWETQAPVAVEVPIPAGTVAARAGSTRVMYVTTAAGRIPIGSTQSERVGAAGDIPAAAVVAGEAGNADVGSVRTMVTAVPTAVRVTNPSPFANGREQELDADFRARIRAHTRTLSRCIPEALELRARSAEINGRRVTASRVWADPINRGNVVIYIDDGSGQVAETAVAPAEVFTDAVAGAVGGEQEFYVRNWPTVGGITLTYTPDGGAPAVLVAGTDYVFRPSNGQVWLHPDSFPTGLDPGDRLEVAGYTHYTGLIRLAQLLIEGRPEDRVNYPAWRAEGVVTRVLPPLIRQFLVRGHIVAGADADREAVRVAVQRALSAYINGLGIGAPFIHAEAIERAMGVRGMIDFTLELPPGNVPVQYNEVARVTAANLTVL